MAVGIVERSGSVLVCQRRKGSRYPLKWEFPGGKLESGEAPEQALTRELREELEIETDAVEFFFKQDWVYPASRDGQESDGEFRVFYYLVRAFRGQPVNKVFEQIRWVRPPELLELDILEGNREAIALLVQHENIERTPRQTG